MQAFAPLHLAPSGGDLLDEDVGRALAEELTEGDSVSNGLVAMDDARCSGLVRGVRESGLRKDSLGSPSWSHLHEIYGEKT